ncbi:MAG: glycosyltransferase [Planctomycetia bacterium]|nr:glycosyltransferase [Planctomycetia bacterium]
MKRVLFLGHSGLAGGAEYCLDTTLRFLDRNRLEPFALFGTEGPMVASARSLEIPAAVVPFSWWLLYERSGWDWRNRLRSPWRVAWLARWIREKGIQAVYTNTACLDEGMRAARACGIPHITHIHEVLQDAFMQPRRYPLEKIVALYYRNSEAVIYESRAAAETARPLLNNDVLFDQKTHVVSNSSRFSRNDVFSTRKPGEIKTILWMGRFSERKNPLLLVEALATLKSRTDWRVRFVGEGPLEGALRQAIRANGLESRSEIVPFQEDVKPVLAAGDLLVLTSREESFGLVLVEAGMFGLPVVATWAEGPTEIVRDGETGFLVDDAPSLAARLNQLLEEEVFRKEMGWKNQQRVAELYDPARNTAKITEILTQPPDLSDEPPTDSLRN